MPRERSPRHTGPFRDVKGRLHSANGKFMAEGSPARSPRSRSPRSRSPRHNMTPEGRARLQELARTRPRNALGQFLPSPRSAGEMKRSRSPRMEMPMETGEMKSHLGRSEVQHELAEARPRAATGQFLPTGGPGSLAPLEESMGIMPRRHGRSPRRT